jgi:hypothetical protein
MTNSKPTPDPSQIRSSDITPPTELVQQWVQATESNDCIGALPTNFEQRICTAAAQWGADQELEACLEWLTECGTWNGWSGVPKLRTTRRPKPPSLKEQGFGALELLKQRTTDPNIIEPLTRALEALPND